VFGQDGIAQKVSLVSRGRRGRIQVASGFLSALAFFVCVISVKKHRCECDTVSDRLRTAHGLSRICYISTGMEGVGKQ